MEHLIGEIFDHLQQNRIQPVIKTRSNANTKARVSPARANEMREMKNWVNQLWKLKYDCGRRWAAEPVFSTVKRMSGEHVAATKTEDRMQETILKFVFYNMSIHLMGKK